MVGKMPQKKKDNLSSEKSFQDVQADHELFLQAFEKPTQIYRYLRFRHILSPVFLRRSLYYMKNRMSRNHKNRATFKVDSLVQKRAKNELQSNHPGSFLNLAFIGFFDKKVEGEGGRAHLEVDVVKISHKKRKESSAPITQTCVGSHDISVNPPGGALVSWQPPSLQVSNHQHSADGGAPKEPLVTISTNAFGSSSNCHQTKSFILQFKVELVHDQENVCEPASKRRRVSRCSSAADNGSDHSAASSSSSSSSDYASDALTTHKAELVVYDRHGRCQLTPGTYELVLHPLNGGAGKAVCTSPRKNATWESAEDLKVEAANLTNFQSSGPTLQFRLSWTHEPGGASSAGHSTNNGLSRHSGSAALEPLTRPKQPLSIILANDKATKPKPQGVSSPEAPQLVLYQFVYNNNGRQQTEARRDFHCPWCSTNCLALYCLLKHLKLCHARFNFTYVPHPKGARIDVSLNDCYDGSYAGNPQDLVWLSGGGGGARFSRAGPSRRAVTTALLVCRPRRSKPSLSEFLEQDHADYDLPRSYILGHNRLYHHTMSCRPIGAHELDEDSEGEHDSQWMRIKTVSMIDDFSDVNDGEKEIMKLWNVHVMKHNFVGDCQLPIACSMFVASHGEEVVRRNLYRNYLLHLVSLYDFGVMGAGAVYNNIRQLQSLIKEKGLHVELSRHWSQQRRVATKAYTSPRSALKAATSSAATSLTASSAARSLLADANFDAPAKAPGTSTHGLASDVGPAASVKAALSNSVKPPASSSVSKPVVTHNTASNKTAIPSDKPSYSCVVASSLKASSHSTSSSAASRNGVCRNTGSHQSASHKSSASSSTSSSSSSNKGLSSSSNGSHAKSSVTAAQVKTSSGCSISKNSPCITQSKNESALNSSSKNSCSGSQSRSSGGAASTRGPSLGAHTKAINGVAAKFSHNGKSSPVILKAPVVPAPSSSSKLSSPSLRIQTGDGASKQSLTKAK